ncbi:hypothetical protein ABN235_19250, partial [Morganella morganii]|uniref:hypothetical protein n=1 Tax=Morganella morganii TaxID=582 RepID=UPI0032DBE942
RVDQITSPMHLVQHNHLHHEQPNLEKEQVVKTYGAMSAKATDMFRLNVPPTCEEKNRWRH